MTFIDLKLDERQFLMLVVVIALFLRGMSRIALARLASVAKSLTSGAGTYPVNPSLSKKHEVFFWRRGQP